ncbi:MAG TPA: nucleotidyltransferase family protein [Nitrososphaerales archaeon]|nr:nucleotidyltransferase family protein [Nitrososphaerales archaeon]
MKQRVVAAVLCGGRGERLRPLTDFFQKTMIPVGPKRRPLLEYIIRLLAHHGIGETVLLTGYRTDEIRSYFEDGSRFGMRIRYSEDKKGAKGSLNALANAMSSGAFDDPELLLVYYGDILSDLDITTLLNTHRSLKADATLVLARGYTLPVGVAEVKDGKRVSGVREKPTLDISVTTGCLVLGRGALRAVKSIAGPQRSDLMTHFVPALLSRKMKVGAYYNTGLWHDMGTLTGYESLNRSLRDDDLPFADGQEKHRRATTTGPRQN